MNQKDYKTLSEIKSFCSTTEQMTQYNEFVKSFGLIGGALTAIGSGTKTAVKGGARTLQAGGKLGIALVKDTFKLTGAALGETMKSFNTVLKTATNPKKLSTEIKSSCAAIKRNCSELYRCVKNCKDPASQAQLKSIVSNQMKGIKTICVQGSSKCRKLGMKTDEYRILNDYVKQMKTYTLDFTKKVGDAFTKGNEGVVKSAKSTKKAATKKEK